MTIVFMLNTTLNLSFRDCSVSASEALPRLFTQRKESSFRSFVARTIRSTTNHAELATQPPSRASAARQTKQSLNQCEYSISGHSEGSRPVLRHSRSKCRSAQSRNLSAIHNSGIDRSELEVSYA